MKLSKTVVGIDIAKRVFQLHWVDVDTGQIVSLQLKRDRFLEHFINRQPCLIGMEYGVTRKQTRRETFLAEMEWVIPWERLFAPIEPVYPKGKNERPPYRLDTMLRIHFMQPWSGLRELAMEESLYDSYSLRRFAGLSLNHDSLPDETTILNFRRLLEKHQLAPRILTEVNGLLSVKDLLLRECMIVDATIISAPGSTKTKSRRRDPDMHQTKKGNNRHFGMRAHIGMDADSGPIHTVTTTSANEHDIMQTHALLHGEAQDVFGDADYTGVEKRDELKDLNVRWHVAMKSSQKNAIQDKRMCKIVDRLEYLKSSVRVRVEHPFRVIKRQFGYTKVRYRGLVKNTAQVLTLFALDNLWMVRGQLMRMTG